MAVKLPTALAAQHATLTSPTSMPTVLSSPCQGSKARRVGALLLAIAAALAAGGAAFAGDEPPRRALALQKLKLVEQMLASPRHRDVDAGGDEAAKALLARTRELLTAGRAAAGAGDWPRAEAAADDALRLVSAGAQGRAARAPTSEVLRERNADLAREIHAYRGALADAVAAGKPGTSPQQLNAIDSLVADADASAAAGRHDEANKALTRGHRLVAAALAVARSGETVTIALKFDTPAAEYAYEQERFLHHQQLLDWIVAEKAPDAIARGSIDHEVQQSQRLRTSARDQAAAGDHAGAIRLMAEATGHLVRALQAAGMPLLR